jgi:hypothetical protein
MIHVADFFHPGSRVKKIPDNGSASKNLSIFNPQKFFLCSQKYDPGCSSQIRIFIFTHPGCQIQGFKKAPYPGSATLILKPVQGAEVKPGGRMFESSPVFHLGGLSEREQTIGLLERGTVVTR